MTLAGAAVLALSTDHAHSAAFMRLNSERWRPVRLTVSLQVLAQEILEWATKPRKYWGVAVQEGPLQGGGASRQRVIKER
jgi:hypothetical protein